MVDVTGMQPIQQIKDIATRRYQVTGLEDGTRYYFAVTAVDKSGNESVKVASASAMSAPMPRGTKDLDISVDTYQSETAWAGTTLLPDNHDGAKPRIIEVNMLGEIVWQYLVPQDLRRSGRLGAGINPGFDVELLANNNTLFVSPGNGVHEIDRKGNLIWSYSDKKVSHDADRLPNGNTLIAFGDSDQKNDAQVKEVNPKGESVWAWYAKDYFDKPPYNSISNEGWTHTNAVSRLPNGNTLISLRNFNLVVEADSKGMVVRTYGEGIFKHQHDPEMLLDGNILVANHGLPQRAIEVDPKTGRIVWQSPGFAQDNIPVRDANRLPNGNTLVTGTTEIVEVTPKGEIVWRLRLQGVSFTRQEAVGRGFYKADRISAQK